MDRCGLSPQDLGQLLQQDPVRKRRSSANQRLSSLPNEPSGVTRIRTLSLDHRSQMGRSDPIVERSDVTTTYPQQGARTVAHLSPSTLLGHDTSPPSIMAWASAYPSDAGTAKELSSHGGLRQTNIH